MLPLLLFNVISGLVIDKATDLATEHVESMIADLLPKEAQKELDKAIKEDPAHEFKNAKDQRGKTVFTRNTKKVAIEQLKKVHHASNVPGMDMYQKIVPGSR